MFVKTVKVNGKNYYYLAKSVYDKKSKRSRQEIVRRISEDEAKLYSGEKLGKNAENVGINEIKQLQEDVRLLKQSVVLNGSYTPRELPTVQNKNRDNGNSLIGKNYGSFHIDILAELKERFKDS